MQFLRVDQQQITRFQMVGLTFHLKTDPAAQKEVNFKKIMVVDAHAIHLFIAVMKHLKTLIFHHLTAVKPLCTDRHSNHLPLNYSLPQDSQ